MVSRNLLPKMTIIDMIAVVCAINMIQSSMMIIQGFAPCPQPHFYLGRTKLTSHTDSSRNSGRRIFHKHLPNNKIRIQWKIHSSSKDDNDGDLDFLASLTDDIIDDMNIQSNSISQSDASSGSNPVTASKSDNDTFSSSSSSSIAPSLSSTPQKFISNEKGIGIGGAGGVIYDVNKLKRNLVQEAVKQYKKELLHLLGTPQTLLSSFLLENDSYTIVPLGSTSSNGVTSSNFSSGGNAILSSSKNTANYNSYYGYGKNFNTRSDAIEDKIAALVQSNPVSTTTDSNLLEGKWELTFATDNVLEILNTSRFVLSKSNLAGSNNIRMNSSDTKSKKRLDSSASTNGSSSSLKNKNKNYYPILRSASREFFLEDLEDEEDPYIIDTIRILGGLVSTRKRFEIIGLTRKSLELQMKSATTFILGKHLHTSNECNNMTKPSDVPVLQILYLDSNLCIALTFSNTNINSSSKDGSKNDKDLLTVYTKNESWMNPKERKKRKVLLFLSQLVSRESPLHLRRNFRSIFNGIQKSRQSKSMKEGSIILEKNLDDKISKLRVLRLGDVYKNDDEEGAWEGDEDPFVHLTADQRQQVMKTMSIEQIKKSRKHRKRGNNRQRKKQQFKRPSDS